MNSIAIRIPKVISPLMLLSASGELFPIYYWGTVATAFLLEWARDPQQLHQWPWGSTVENTSTPVQGERTREGNDLYHEMMASGVIKHPGWKLISVAQMTDLGGWHDLVAAEHSGRTKLLVPRYPSQTRGDVLFKHVFVTRKSLIDVFCSFYR